MRPGLCLVQILTASDALKDHRGIRATEAEVVLHRSMNFAMFGFGRNLHHTLRLLILKIDRWRHSLCFNRLHSENGFKPAGAAEKVPSGSLS